MSDFSDEEREQGRQAGRQLLLKMLADADDGSDRTHDITTRPNYNRITPPLRDGFHELIERAEAKGAVVLEHNAQSRLTGTVARLRLLDADRLATFLGVSRAADRAAAALTLVPANDEAVAASVRDELGKAWAVGKTAYGLGVEDVGQAAALLRVLSAVGRGQHDGLDMRTFSRRTFGDSKLVERLAAPLASALRKHLGIAGATPSETLAALGLVKLPMPMLLRATLCDSDGNRLAVEPFIGLTAERVLRMRLDPQPSYLLTVENLTSFTRHCLEITDGGAVVFTGGFPSPAVVTAIRHLAGQVDQVFHWGDIDGGGVRIFRHLELAIGSLGNKALRPHLMNADLAVNGTPLSKEGARAGLSTIATSDSAVADLAAWLNSINGRGLEQEELDPCSPLRREVHIY